jgi:hypothetical protein
MSDDTASKPSDITVTLTLPPALLPVLPALIEALQEAHFAAVRAGLALPGRRRP